MLDSRRSLLSIAIRVRCLILLTAVLAYTLCRYQTTSTQDDTESMSSSSSPPLMPYDASGTIVMYEEMSKEQCQVGAIDRIISTTLGWMNNWDGQ